METTKVRKALAVFLVAAFFLSAWTSLFPLSSGDITASRTYSATSADSYGWTLSDVYSDARDDVNADTIYHDQASGRVGQELIGGVTYSLTRGFVYFDTSDLPDGVTLSTAVLSLTVTDDQSTTDFNVTVQGTGTYPHNPTEVGDYYLGWYGSTSMGSRSTSEISGGKLNITLNAAGMNQISKTGTTRLTLRSQNDIDNVAPTDSEYLWFGNQEGGNGAVLYVTYTVVTGGGGEYSYSLYGPYTDTGAVYDGTARIRLFPVGNDSITFDLSADGVTASSYSVTFDQPPVLMSWNISSSGNYTRVYYFTDVLTESIFVFIPAQETPFYLYSFTVNDFFGVTNGYLEAMLYFNGSNRVVCRQRIDSINNVPFYLMWGEKYDMRIVSDDGTLSLGSFTALSESNPTIIIPNGAFPRTPNYASRFANASRTNATAITVFYDDPDDETYSVLVSIKHQLTNGTYVTDYLEGSTTNTFSLVWNGGSPTRDYLVVVEASTVDGSKSWSLSCPYTRTNPNVWAGLNELGDGLPVEVQYLPAIILIVASVLVFSYWHISAGAWISWGVAGFCILVGWLPNNGTPTVAAMGFAAVICAGITIGEFKLRERTV